MNVVCGLTQKPAPCGLLCHRNDNVVWYESEIWCHCSCTAVQLQDCVWSLAMPHSVLALKHSAVMALLRTAIRSLIVGIDYWLQLLLDVWSVPQGWNLKRKFHHSSTVIKARMVVTVRQLPVRQGEWEPTHCECLPPPPVLSAHLRHGQAQLQSALAS